MEYEISLLTSMGIAVLFALSLNMITGFCGQISLGHAAFLGVGAYTSVLLCQAGVPFLLTVPVAMLLAGLVGVVASVAGLAGGIVVATGLKAAFAAFGLDLPATGLALTGSTIAWSLAVGIVVTLLGALRKQGKKRGVAALCIGGGEATALAVELI